jgi:2-haloacid dehalogenase
MSALDRVNTLTFDIFGTVLDLTGAIVPTLESYLRAQGSQEDPRELWRQWRARQRLEQHQDTILQLGHSGYLEAARRALLFTLRANQIPHAEGDSHELIRVFFRLQPFEDARLGLERLGKRFRLVALSNGNPELLDHLIPNSLGRPEMERISVARFGNFKPHPAVYRGAAVQLQRDPAEILMVAAHSFDILGARACGFRGAFVNRYRLPYEESPLQPDLIVTDFLELADRLRV